jgi:hypothetical protein
MKTYRFSVEEINSEKEAFNVLYPDDKTEYDIVEEAARLFYYGKSGWKEGWPLTFAIETMEGRVIIRAHVFIGSSLPHFIVILCETRPGASTGPLSTMHGEYNETSRPGPWGSLWAKIRKYLVRRLRDHAQTPSQ